MHWQTWFLKILYLWKSQKNQIYFTLVKIMKSLSKMSWFQSAISRTCNFIVILLPRDAVQAR